MKVLILSSVLVLMAELQILSQKNQVRKQSKNELGIKSKAVLLEINNILMNHKITRNQPVL